MISKSVGENISDLAYENLKLKECRVSRQVAECSWVNYNGMQVVVGQDDTSHGWVEHASRWQFSSLHDPFEISDAINAEVLRHRRKIRKKSWWLGPTMRMDAGERGNESITFHSPPQTRSPYD